MAFNTPPNVSSNNNHDDTHDSGAAGDMGNNCCSGNTTSSRSLVKFSTSISTTAENGGNGNVTLPSSLLNSPSPASAMQFNNSIISGQQQSHDVIEPFARHIQVEELRQFLAQLGIQLHPSTTTTNGEGGGRNGHVLVSKTSSAAVPVKDSKTLPSEEVWLLINATKANAAKQAVRTQNWSVVHPMRKNLWKWLCRRLFLYDAEWDQVISLYKETVPMIFGYDDKRLRDVPLPGCIDRALMETYFLNEAGQEKAKKIVCVLAYLKPSITYSPYIYPVVSLLLHYIDDEAECFACIDSILEPRKKVPRLYLSETRAAWKASGEALQDLVKKRAKSAHSTIINQQAKLKKVASTTSMAAAAKIDWEAHQAFDNWIVYIFKHLPFDYLVRIMDCFLYEGMKVLFRTALALLKLYSKQQGPHTLPLNEGMRRFCKNIRDHCSVENLLSAGFNISRLSQSEILKFVSKYEKDIVERERRGEKIDGYPYELDAGGGGMKRNQSSNRILALNDERSLGLAINDRQAIDWKRTCPASSITDTETFFSLWNWLPARHQLFMPKLLFTTENHGISMLSFFHRVDEEVPTVLLVRTTRGDIFGAYCSAAWTERGHKGNLSSFFGTGESFIFTLAPKKVRYGWVGLKNPASGAQQSMFMSADNQTIIVGGGSTGQAIRFDGSFSQGRTQASTTFNNPPLSSEEDFICSIVEVYGLAEMS